MSRFFDIIDGLDNVTVITIAGLVLLAIVIVDRTTLEGT